MTHKGDTLSRSVTSYASRSGSFSTTLMGVPIDAGTSRAIGAGYRDEPSGATAKACLGASG